MDRNPRFKSDLYSFIDTIKTTTHYSSIRPLHLPGKRSSDHFHLSLSEPTSCMEKDARDVVVALQKLFHATHQSSQSLVKFGHEINKEGHDSNHQHSHHWTLVLTLGPQIQLLPSSDDGASTIFAATVSSSEWISTLSISKSSLMMQSSPELPSPLPHNRSGAALGPLHYWSHSASGHSSPASADPTREIEEIAAMVSSVLTPIGIETFMHRIHKKSVNGEAAAVWLPHVNLASVPVPFVEVSNAFGSSAAMAKLLSLSKKHKVPSKSLVVRWGDEADCIEWP